MKRIAIMAVFLLCLVQCLASCAKDYQADYPDNFTTEYCVQNYVFADPNLMFLERAKNDATESYNWNGKVFRFFAIRDVSPEDYLVVTASTFFVEHGAVRVVKDQDIGIENYEIFTKEIACAEIYRRKSVDIDDLLCAGEKCYESQIGQLTDAQIDDLIDYIKDCLDSQQFSEMEYYPTTHFQPGAYGNPVILRIQFEEYDYLVWDALTVRRDGTRYIVFYIYDDTYPEPSGMWTEHRWVPVLIPLPEEIAALIPEE